MKTICFSVLCFILPLCTFAQSAAVLDFYVDKNISPTEVVGVSAVFTTYFRPRGYTVVERSKINDLIIEQGWQRDKLTQIQEKRIGELLSVSIIVVGDIKYAHSKYLVNIRAIKVETGNVLATDSVSFVGANYRDVMKKIATDFASRISDSISHGNPMPQTETTSQEDDTLTELKVITSPQLIGNDNPNEPYVLYRYLKIFPKNLGHFSSCPTGIISQINNAVEYGYNTWRLPFQEEVELMFSEHILTEGSYMTYEKQEAGLVRLVTDQELADVIAQKIAEEEYKKKIEEQTRLAEEEKKKMEEEEEERHRIAEEERKKNEEREEKEEEERRAKEEQRRVEQERIELEEERARIVNEKIENARKNGYVYLGLPSGTLWKDSNEKGLYSLVDALNLFGKQLPTKSQFEELIKYCRWVWGKDGYNIVGPSGETIFLPAEGYTNCYGETDYEGSFGRYWTRSRKEGEYFFLLFDSRLVDVAKAQSCFSRSIRVVAQ